MNQGIYKQRVMECNQGMKEEVMLKMQEVFDGLKGTIGEDGFDASRAGFVFENTEIQEIMPYIVDVTQGISKRYLQVFREVGMESGRVDIHWMAIFSKLKEASPKYREMKEAEVQKKIVVHKRQTEQKEVEEEENLGTMFTSGGAILGGILGGTVKGLTVGGPGAVFTGVVFGAVGGAVAGYVAYKIIVNVLKEDSASGRKLIEIVQDTYEVNKKELEQLCQDEQKRAYHCLKEWLDDIEQKALDNISAE